jgi:ElaB/YqjD/DUF883 family membrane-anchored ribosome-binding protein
MSRLMFLECSSDSRSENRRGQDKISSDYTIIHCPDCAFSFRAYLKERRKINGRLPMAEVNKTQQTGSGMTDTNELESTRAGSGMTDTHELQSTRTHGQQAADDLKSAAGTIGAEHRDKAEQTEDDSRDRVRTFREDTNQIVRENPTKAVFTALGIGFVLGLIFRR